MITQQLSNAALLIIDMQVGLLEGNEVPWQADQVMANINQLITQAHAVGTPVLAVRHTGPAGSPIEVGSPLWQLHSALAVNPQTDYVFNKTRPDCFNGTTLSQKLDELAIKHLVIVGMKTQYCVDTTCRSAAERGWSPILVADAHTCMDTPLLSAEQIIAHHNATLNGAFARLMNTREIIFARNETGAN